MKLSTFFIAIVLAGIGAAASAAGQGKAMQPVVVSGAAVGECVPPNDHTGHACDVFNGLIHANFTPREIGMLFGNQSSYPEARTGGIDRLQRRYQAVVQAYVAAQQAASQSASVASK
jgi:hypothetical protein